MNFLEVRYSYDDPVHHGLRVKEGDVPLTSKMTRSKLLSESIKITPALFPHLAVALKSLGTVMRLERELDCFVTAEPMMQAYCVPHRAFDGDTFSVVLSSVLVERLRPEEVRFVIGHEVGHFLCEHWRYPKDEEEGSLGDRLAALSLSRSAEVSADRIGMLAAGSMEDACGAMIKVAAGLGFPHIQPDIPSILSQYRELSNQEGDANAIWSSHPIIPLRIRALLRFEPICRKLWRGDEVTQDELAALDGAVEADFHRITGHALTKLRDEHLESVRVWGLAFLFCADGVISKAEQELLRQELGADRAAKVLRFLKSQGEGTAKAVESKLMEACGKARSSSLEGRMRLVTEFENLVEAAGLHDAPIQNAMEQMRRLLDK